MIRASIVRTIATKELLEALRDRRTLVLMVLLPVLLYPALLVIVSQVISAQSSSVEARPSVVGIAGADEGHPAVRALRRADDVEVVIADGTLPALDAAASTVVASTPTELGDVGTAPSDGADVPVDRAATPADHADVRGDDAAASDAALAARAVDLDSLAWPRPTDVRVDLRDWPEQPDDAGTAHAVVYFDAVADTSRLALDRTETVLASVRRDLLAARLAAHDLPDTFAQPLRVTSHNVAPPSRVGAHLLAALLPVLMVVTVLMGAYYPAIDLTAGEKERGTIQTLFTAPVTAREVVGGKYLAVLGISLLTGTANLASIALVIGQNLLVSDALREHLDVSLPLPALAALMFGMFAVALVFSGVMMAVAVVARSFKEAQALMTPVYLLCMVPAMLAQLPGVAWSTQLGALPAIGPLLYMKAALIGEATAGGALLVGASSAAYAALALAVAARLFGQEQVLVGERAALRVLPRRSDILPRPTPPAELGALWYGVCFVLLFYVGGALQSRWPQPGVVATLWLVLLAPTVAFACWLRLDLRETFSLRRPPIDAWAAATLLAVGGVVVVNALNHFIELHLLPTPDALAEEMGRFLGRPDSIGDWLWLLFVLAVSPAICEELLFRGFLLSSLRARTSDTTRIVVVGLAFGLFHLSVYRLFGTAALGMLMTFVAVRARSIYPAMLFHLLNNAAAVVVYGRFGDDLDVPPAAIGLGVVCFIAGLAATARLPERSA